LYFDEFECLQMMHDICQSTEEIHIMYSICGKLY
jgi:hypothetical protein